MFQFLTTVALCLTVIAVVLPVAFLVALSLPHNSELRQMAMKVCYWGVALVAVGYFAMPFDVLPDVFFPFGFADDLVVLGVGWMSARKAMKPAVARPSLN